MTTLDINITKIKNTAREYSLLTVSEENDLIEILKQSDAKQVQSLAELFDEDPRWILRIYENYCLKKQTIMNGNQNDWNNLISREIKEVEEYCLSTA